MKITQFDNQYSVKLGQGGTTLVSGSSGGSNSGLGGDVSGTLGNVSVNGFRRSVSLGSNLGTGVSTGDVLTIMSTAGTPVARFATPSNSGTYRKSFAGGEEVVQAHGTMGATETINLANGNYHAGTLDANCTFTFTPPTSGVLADFILELTQDGTGGWDSTFPASVVGGTALATSLDQTASTTSLLTFLTRDGGTTWYGFLAGGGSSGSGSFGSNSTRVSALPSAGAGILYANATHVHDGIGTVTASASNTLDRGTLNLRAGSNISFGLTDSDGSGGLDTVTISASSSGGGSSLTVEEVDGSPTVSATKLVLPNGTLGVVGTVATYTPAAGGGGITHTYIGYNTVGGSTETPIVNSKVYLKQVTIASDGFLASIGANITGSSGTSTLAGPSVAVYTDSAGAPGSVIASNGREMYLRLPDGGRWFDVPLGAWLTAGTYWLGVRTTDTGATIVCQIKFDGSGSDRTGVTGLGEWRDWSQVGSPTTTSNKYSIRGLILT